jgi:universal stress protein E
LSVRTVLAAADLTREPDAAITAAARVTALLGGDLHVVHSGAPGVDPDGVRARLEAELPPGAFGTLLGGDPCPAITAHAAAIGADLIVLGRRRERSVLTGLLGSTSDNVIRSARVPCLLVNGSMPDVPRRILLALDRSVPAREAFIVCSSLVRFITGLGHPLTVHLLTVSAFGQPGRRGAGRVDLKRYAKKLRADAPAARVTQGVISAPLPAEGIIECAASVVPDMIVMGTHGAGALGRLLMGSVAQGVARTAELPLLLVPPPRTKLTVMDAPQDGAFSPPG